MAKLDISKIRNDCKIKKFALENFKVFKDKQVFNIAPITILTGANSSGKSSLIKSMNLLKIIFDGYKQDKNNFLTAFEALDDRVHGTPLLGFRKKNKTNNSIINQRELYKYITENYGGFDNLTNYSNDSKSIAFSIEYNPSILLNFFELKYEITFSVEEGRMGITQESIHIVECKCYNNKLLEYIRQYYTNFEFEDLNNLVLCNIGSDGFYDYKTLFIIGIIISWDDYSKRSSMENKSNSIQHELPIKRYQFTENDILGANFIKYDIENYIKQAINSNAKDNLVIKYKDFGNYLDSFGLNYTDKELFVIILEIRRFISAFTTLKYPHLITGLDMQQTIGFLHWIFKTEQSLNKGIKTDLLGYDFTEDYNQVRNILNTQFFKMNEKVIRCLFEYLKDPFDSSFVWRGDRFSQNIERQIFERIFLDAYSKIGMENMKLHISSKRNISKRFGIVNDDSEISKFILSNRNLKFEREQKEHINYYLKEFGIGDSFDYTFDEETGIFKINIIKDGKKNNLNDMGYGVSQVLPIILACVDISFAQTVIIEEPESNLHPALQSKLANMIAEASKRNNFIIETHSEYLIRKLQYLTAKKEIKPEDTQIYYFYPPNEVPEGERQVYPINIQEDGSLTKNFGKGFFDEAGNLDLLLYQMTKTRNN